MTRKHHVLNGEETKLHHLLIQMSQATDKAIKEALKCFRVHDVQLAQRIIANDESINAMQHQIEDECFIAIALHQPVAVDLRDLVSDTHVAIELERIADHAADIAKIVVKMESSPNPAFAESIDRLGQRCRSMLARVMSAYGKCDVRLARKVAAEDDEVDRTEQRITEEILTKMNHHTDEATSYTHTLWVAHNVERIGDRVTNIAERIVFLATGENVDLNRSFDGGINRISQDILNVR